MSSAPLQNAYVVISGNKIENIICENTYKNYRKNDGKNDCENDLAQFIAGRNYILHDHGNAIILPGFINLHTHLEHTHLRALAQESDFLKWLPRLMEAAATWSVTDRINSATAGIEESILGGTTTVVDFSYNGASLAPLAKQKLRTVVGLEIFGVDESAAEDQWQQWLERRDSLISNPIVKSALDEGLMAITVAAHAPYTVCPALWEKAKSWSKNSNLPLLTHLSESKEELNWFKSEDADLKQFLIYAFGKKIANFAQLYDKLTAWKNFNCSPVEHLHRHGLLTNNLLAAHCVHIDDLDINLLKRAGVSIAHCPHSNITLKCGQSPLEKLLANDVQVGLGTDSAASSNNLNMLKEADFAIKLHHGNCSQLDIKNVLELITIKAAHCLGLGDKLGSLEAGKLADIGVFALPEDKNGLASNDENGIYNLLIDGKCKLERLLVNGKTVYSNE